MQDNPFQNINPMPEMPDLRKNLKWILFGMVAFSILVSIKQCAFIISPDESGIIQRFGRYHRTLGPGLNFKIPFQIEELTLVKVTKINRFEFGFQESEDRSQSNMLFSTRDDKTSKLDQNRKRSNFLFNQKVGFDRDDSFLSESLMMTGDLNFADVTWIIQYKITDPKAYLFNVKNVEETVRNMSESVMRDVVGDASIDEVITFGKQEVEQTALGQLQTVLEQFQCGVTITRLAFQDVNPPERVKSAFEDVNKAEQEKNKMINQAWAAYNDVVPRAKGEAEKIILEADAYAVNRTNLAKGAADRFLQTWEEYRKATDVTRRRLYLEALTEILPKVEAITIVDGDLQGVLPLLNLNEGGPLEK